MQITTAQLNEVANLLGTTDKNVVFSAIIKTLVEAGLEVSVAFEMVFGEGTYNKMAGFIYDSLKAA